MIAGSNAPHYRYGAALAVIAAAMLFPRATAAAGSGREADRPTHVLPDSRVVQLLSLAERPERQRIARVLAARTAFPELGKYKNAQTPKVANTIKDQTPIENQGGRGTCTYFAATAALEAAYKKAGHGDLDLSEQYLVWLRDVTMLTDDYMPRSAPTQIDAYLREDQLGSLSGGGAVYNLQLLSEYGIGRAKDDPYIGDSSYEEYTSSYYTGYGLENYQWDIGLFPQAPINKWNMAPAQLPSAIRTGPLYGVEKYVSLSESDFRDPRCIEWLISQGHSVVMDLEIFQDPYNPARPIWTRNAKLNDKEEAGHAVLIVGYDRPRHFFVLKNSWGPIHYDASTLAPDLKDIATEYDNYYLMDYNYLTGADGAGFIVSVTKPDSGRFAHQRLLGDWKMQVMKKGSTKPLLDGTLTWRHLPKSDAYLSNKDSRVGDLLCQDNKMYRVNGEIDKSSITLYIDFDHPAMAVTDHAGLRLTGHLDKGKGKAEITGGMSGDKQEATLLKEPVGELTFSLVHE